MQFSISSYPLDECPSRQACQLNCKSFAGWSELKSHLVSLYGIEDVVIGLQADYVRSESVESLDSIEVTDFSRDSVLLSMPVGRRVAVVVHLIATSAQVRSRAEWRPVSDYREILLCAKGVHCRAVRDRVVERMSNRGPREVVSFFLDSEGRIESSSGTAREFCEMAFQGRERVDGFFPLEQWHYVQGALQRQKNPRAQFYKEESLVFAFYEEAGIVDCLLQGMGSSGYLLCLALEG